MIFPDVVILKMILVGGGWAISELRKIYLVWKRNQKVGALSLHKYFSFAKHHRLYLRRLTAHNMFYTVTLQSYHLAILNNINGFAIFVSREKHINRSKSDFRALVINYYNSYAEQILNDTNSLNIPEPYFSALRAETLHGVEMLNLSIFEILESPKFKALTNKEVAGMMLYELYKFLLLTENHIIPKQKTLNGSFKGLIYTDKDGNIYENT